MSKGHLLETIPTLHKMWSLELKIMPLRIVNTYSNIIHTTVGGWQATMGNRIPTLSFKSGTSNLEVCVPYQTPYKCVDVGTLPLRKFSSVVVRQKIYNNHELYITVEIDGKEKLKAKNIMPQKFQNAKVYLSSPWYAASDVMVDDYKFYSGELFIF